MDESKRKTMETCEAKRRTAIVARMSVVVEHRCWVGGGECITHSGLGLCLGLSTGSGNSRVVSAVRPESLTPQ